MDKGYVGIGNDHPHRPRRRCEYRPLTTDQKAGNRVIASHRIVVNHVTTQLNRLEVLTQTYRHRRSEHRAVVWVAAVPVNRDPKTA